MLLLVRYLLADLLDPVILCHPEDHLDLENLEILVDQGLLKLPAVPEDLLDLRYSNISHLK